MQSKRKARLSVSNIFLSVSKHFQVSKLNRPWLRSLYTVFRTWFSLVVRDGTRNNSDFSVYHGKQEPTNSKHFPIHKTPVRSMPNLRHDNLYDMQVEKRGINNLNTKKHGREGGMTQRVQYQKRMRMNPVHKMAASYFCQT